MDADGTHAFYTDHKDVIRCDMTSSGPTNCYSVCTGNDCNIRTFGNIRSIAFADNAPLVFLTDPDDNSPGTSNVVVCDVDESTTVAFHDCVINTFGSPADPMYITGVKTVANWAFLLSADKEVTTSGQVDAKVVICPFDGKTINTGACTVATDTMLTEPANLCWYRQLAFGAYYVTPGPN